MRQKTTRSILVLASDPVFAAVLSGELEKLGWLPTYLGSRCPSRKELAGILAAYEPALVIAELHGSTQCAELAGAVAAVDSMLPVVAVGRGCDPETLQDLLDAGVAEYLSWPVQESCLRECLNRASAASPRPETGSPLYAFIPAKAGSGATTLAFNLSFALGQKIQPVLLADFDFTGGTTRLMLKSAGGPSAADALRTARMLHPLSWRDLVASYGDVDLLHSGAFDPHAQVNASDLDSLLRFVGRQYRAVFADLSGSFEPHSLDLLDKAHSAFLVCTPDPGSLLLAREKLAWLRARGHTRMVRLLLNRHCRKSLSVAQVEDFVGAPVEFTFPNDFNSVSRSVLQAMPASPISDLGRQCERFAQTLVCEAAGTPYDAPAAPMNVSCSGQVLSAC